MTNHTKQPDQKLANYLKKYGMSLAELEEIFDELRGKTLHGLNENNAAWIAAHMPETNPDQPSELDTILSHYYIMRAALDIPDPFWKDKQDSVEGNLKADILAWHQAQLKAAYENGRKDEAKICAKASRHDYKGAIKVELEAVLAEGPEDTPSYGLSYIAGRLVACLNGNNAEWRKIIKAHIKKLEGGKE